jgi:hypothetical protein
MHNVRDYLEENSAKEQISQTYETNPYQYSYYDYKVSFDMSTASA